MESYQKQTEIRGKLIRFFSQEYISIYLAQSGWNLSKKLQLYWIEELEDGIWGCNSVGSKKEILERREPQNMKLQNSAWKLPQILIDSWTVCGVWGSRGGWGAGAVG